VWAGRRPDAPGPAAAASARTPPAEALLAYRRGRARWEARRGEAMTDALYQFRLATALDPTFAAAYVGEAQVYAFGARTGPAAEAALARALALDSTLAAAWATRGFVRAFQRWDWAGAERAFARAVALDPDDATTLQWLASLRMVQRRLPEAEAALRRALALQPDRAALHADLCEALYYRRDWAGARAACARALALDPAHPFAQNHRRWAHVAGPGGRAAAARWLDSARVQPLDDAALARLHARLGARDSALAHVERAVAARMFVAPFLHPDPVFDPLRGDPRWRAAMGRVGLE
jgi:tetratricopeptide (TPR) repeat protein